MPDSSHVWTGHAAAYDSGRPSPPASLPDLLTQLIATPRPALVVDLGSGTGLSTAIWAGRADRIIGIEPNADMCRVATSRTTDATIAFRDATAQETGLPAACADVVTASQSFHWMEPVTTLAEIARILRPGGIFAAYDYDSPPSIRWELDQIALQVMARLVELVRQRGLPQTLRIWPKDQHLRQMRESGHFRFAREVYLHSIERGDAARYMAMTRSSAFNSQFTFTDEELGLDRLAAAASQYIGDEPIPWVVSYRVRFAVK